MLGIAGASNLVLRSVSSRVPWRPEVTASLRWSVVVVVGLVLVAGIVFALPRWIEARAAVERSTSVAESGLGRDVAPEVGVGCSGALASAAVPLPEQTAVLEQLRRVASSESVSLADLQFSRSPAGPLGVSQLVVQGVLLGRYGASKDVLRSVLERYPGAVLTSSDLQRQPEGEAVRWSFALQIWALSGDGRSLGGGCGSVVGRTGSASAAGR